VLEALHALMRDEQRGTNGCRSMIRHQERVVLCNIRLERIR